MGFFDGLFFGRRRKAVQDALVQAWTKINDPEENSIWPDLLPPEVQAARKISAGRFSGPYGRCPENPVPVCGPLGEVIYLSRLVDVHDQRIIIHRLGSLEREETGQALDLYEIADIGGRNWALLYFDMYNQRQSGQPPEGFTFGDFEGICGVSLNCPEFPKKLWPLMCRYSRSYLGLTAIHPELSKNRAWTKLTRPTDHRQKVEALGYAMVSPK